MELSKQREKPWDIDFTDAESSRGEGGGEEEARGITGCAEVA